MGGFLKHVLFIITLILVGALVLHCTYDFIFTNTSARDKTQLALKQKQPYVDYVFLGSSRVENYIDCETIEAITGKSCRNYALSGGSYQDAYVLLKLLKKQGLTYGHLFIQLDTGMKNEQMTTAFKASLIPLIDHYEIKIENVDLSLSWSERYVPFYKYAEYDYLYGIRACFAQLYKNQEDNVKLGYHSKNYVGNTNASTISDLVFSNKFIELTQEEAKKDNAKIHFYTSPYCVDMKNTELFNQFKLYYPGYINYANFYLEPAYFANCTHMNHQGAQIFTRQIVKDFNL